MKKLIVVLVLIVYMGCISQEENLTEEESLDEESQSEESFIEESQTEEAVEEESFTAEESLEIARQFVLNSPTYKFDGLELQHVETMEGECQSCWIFVFEFTSRHGGYGDRSKQMVTQVMTKHTARVTVENGKVVHSVLDDVWDMINQEMIG